MNVSDAPPRYFAQAAMPAVADIDSLAAWAKELGRVARHAEHPWNAALMVESLAQQAKAALSARPPRSQTHNVSVHSSE